jgi:hypothetical protein
LSAERILIGWGRSLARAQWLRGESQAVAMEVKRVWRRLRRGTPLTPTTSRLSERMLIRQKRGVVPLESLIRPHRSA